MLTIKTSEEFRNAEDILVGIEIDASIIENGQKVGYVQVMESLDEDGYVSCAYLASIEVIESHRNQGIGSKTIKELSEKYGAIYLCPTDENNARLYARLGEEVDDFPYELQGAYDEWGRIFLIE